MSLLEDSVNELLNNPSTESGDFSVKINLQQLVQKIKDLFRRSPKNITKRDAQESVLRACYEYLEDSGLDAGPTLISILNSQIAQHRDDGDMSEIISEYLEPTKISEIEALTKSFMDSSKTFSLLSPAEKHLFKNIMDKEFGKKVSKSYIDALMVKSPEGSISKSTIGLFAVLGILYLGKKTLQDIFSDKTRNI